MRGVRYGQGIDISFAIDKHESVVKGCRLIGGQEGIVTHSSMAMLTKNHVQDTSLRAIAMTEMSMGAVHRNTVRNANGVGILCGDHSMCSIERNDVADTRSATEDGDLTRAGFGILVQLGAEAELHGNELADNPRRLGVFFYSVVRWKR
jgi:hypothetical protein